MTSAQSTANTDTEVSDKTQAATEALADPVEIASSEALSAAFAASDSSTPSDQVVEEQTQTTLHPSPVVEAIETAKTEAAKAMVTETAQNSDGDNESVSDSSAGQPAVGITAAGRAVNDPRISPKPITETPVTTEQGQLFWQPEAPPVTVVERDVQRASNDPRGPRATGSL
jgi:ribonuclease E